MFVADISQHTDCYLCNCQCHLCSLIDVVSMNILLVFTSDAVVMFCFFRA